MRQCAEQGGLPVRMLNGLLKKSQSRLARVLWGVPVPRVVSQICEELHSQTKPWLSGACPGEGMIV